jgi:hypothetical protein
MDVMLMFYETKEEAERGDDAAEAPAYWGAWRAYVDAVAASGQMKSGEGLAPPRTAITVRVEGGARQVQDGPFADTKEHLGGFFILDVPNIEAAIEWAARAPCAAAGAGRVELRRLLPPPADAA